MVTRWVLAIWLAVAASAWAQSNPGFVKGQIPNANQWNSYFAGKADVTNGSLTNPSFNGTVTGNPTFSGNPVFTGNPSWPTGNFSMNGLTLTGTVQQTMQSNWTYDYSQAPSLSRWIWFQNTLAPSVDTTNTWEGGVNMYVYFNGPGIAQSEINAGHSYFEMRPGAQSASTIEGYEVSALNSGTMATWRDYIAIFHNDVAGVVQNGANISVGLRNENTTPGAITTWSAFNLDAMTGAGSLPTLYYFLQNKDPNALIGTAGKVHIGNAPVGDPGGTVRFQISTPDSLNTSLGMRIRNTNSLDVLYTTNDGVTNSPKFNGVYTNGASATTTTWSAHAASLIQQNAAGGAVGTFAGFDFQIMSGGGSTPTSYYAFLNRDVNALSAFLGKVAIGSIGAPGASNLFQITATAHAGATVPLLIRDDLNTNLFLINDQSNVTIGGGGNQGQIALAGSTSGFTNIRPSTVTANGTWFLQDLASGSDTVVGKATADTLTNKTLTDYKDNGTKYTSTTTSVASSTTLTNVTGLAIPLTASGVYRIDAYLPMTVNGTPGARIALGTSDTLTASTISFTCNLHNSTTITAGGTPATSLGSTCVDAAVAGTYAELHGTIVVGVAGTLTVQIAQNTSDLTATVALANGNLTARRSQ